MRRATGGDYNECVTCAPPGHVGARQYHRESQWGYRVVGRPGGIVLVANLVVRVEEGAVRIEHDGLEAARGRPEARQQRGGRGRHAEQQQDGGVHAGAETKRARPRLQEGGKDGTISAREVSK